MTIEEKVKLLKVEFSYSDTTGELEFLTVHFKYAEMDEASLKFAGGVYEEYCNYDLNKIRDFAIERAENYYKEKSVNPNVVDMLHRKISLD
ncbi:hypothetical protein FQ085_06585 [Planococcus sp. ANT_H30]|uniref:hypothetical protein n=1 Tax=Planococcus sp. ANT_H30 TaxID=2597347 RepID=UPI0011F07F99|nr:hypothetical protein [Planococcus sp. ANT_H30]KAA0957713.1 hypothetical protein FQ085_06585 [Planococcus sp. ANT_H30]